ncbi:glycosyltransferase family 1 protein [Massilibacteroides sp.]|uniref:glycosyltransferase family 1 protein n=1 Tax=Massilibacteroides sp. TaxID=2034766 RepID=UPI002638CE89|nr:glycosyltransferase family 1 protein [Massilibacteroides sp.]MDD4516521.1 glycosyltransferase family 1 protein [Massilibacteroides sp.]
MDKYLHIISLNIPWPANYGGVIDIFYKLKALHKLGVKIILHAFEYDRPQASELSQFCEQVYYYKRHTGIVPNLSILPYNVISRRDPLLLERLLKDNYPILFEGLHTCYYLSDRRLKDRLTFVRGTNIEHDYYYHLYKAETDLVKRTFSLIESKRFAFYEKQLRHAKHILAISASDEASFRKRYPEMKIDFIPAFHANEEITSIEGSSDFILYHAKLSVVENEKAALYLIKNVFSQLKHTCVIAGMNPSPDLLTAARRYDNIRIEANPTENRMSFLIHEAQIHALVTFQDTGLKLKLLNSLFAGRHVLVNSLMLAGSGLDSLCSCADSPTDIIKQCNKLMLIPFTSEDIVKRKAVLFPTYDNEYQAKRLYDIIYGNN